MPRCSGAWHGLKSCAKPPFIPFVPRKYFKRFLPSHDSIREHRHLQFLKPLLSHHNLWHLHKRSVAGGVAIGFFTGMIPFPIQMLSAAILAIIFRANLPVAVASTWYTNPLTSVPIFFLAYKLGELITGEKARHATEFTYDWSSGHLLDFFSSMFQWFTSLGTSLLVGSAVVGIAMAVVGYFLVRFLWDLYIVIQWRRRAKRRTHHA
jgi:uncharacterized protein